MNNLIENEERMSSLEIAKITGKNHRDVMRAIRAMEPAWEKIGERKFALSSYKTSQNKTVPCYSLTKTECLYIATKFNDEARAKLVLRWEELERERFKKLQESAIYAERLYDLEQMIRHTCELVQSVSTQFNISISTTSEQKPRTTRTDQLLAVKKCFLTTDIARELGLSAAVLNETLKKKGIQEKHNRTWCLNEPYQDKGLSDFITYGVHGKFFHKQMVWTEKGRAFIYEIIENGLSPADALQQVNEMTKPVTTRQLSISFATSLGE